MIDLLEGLMEAFGFSVLMFLMFEIPYMLTKTKWFKKHICDYDEDVDPKDKVD